MIATEEELDEVAALLKDLYIGRRRFIYPWYKYNAQKHEGAWLKAARFILDRGCDPETFIAAQFHNRVTGYPYPNQLFCESAFSRYKEYSRLYPRNLGVQLELELDRLETAVEKHGNILAALSDEGESFSPLFKYAIAKRLELEFPYSWHKEARIYALTHPEAVTVYSKLCEDLINWRTLICSN